MDIVKYGPCAFALGSGLVILWFLLLVIARIWVSVWAWIDDSKPSSKNPITRRVMRLLGYEEDGCAWAYRNPATREVSDGEIGTFLPACALFLAPFALLLYPITIGVMTAFALAHIARFTRRHKKLFDKHLKDPDAHKEPR